VLVCVQVQRKRETAVLFSLASSEIACAAHTYAYTQTYLLTLALKYTNIHPHIHTTTSKKQACILFGMDLSLFYSQPQKHIQHSTQPSVSLGLLLSCLDHTHLTSVTSRIHTHTHTHTRTHTHTLTHLHIHTHYSLEAGFFSQLFGHDSCGEVLILADSRCMYMHAFMCVCVRMYVRVREFVFVSNCEYVCTCVYA